MIRLAQTSDKQPLYKLRKHYFNFDDNGFNEYLNDYLFEHLKHFILEENNQMISSLILRNDILCLNQKLLEVGFISHVLTLEEYRHQGYMHKLLKAVLKQEAQRHLVTLIEAYDPKYYISLGLKVISHKQQYYLNDYPFKLSYNLIEKASALQLLECYQRFIKNFKVFSMRNLKYYQDIFKKYQVVNGGIFSIGINNQVLAYVFYEINNQIIEVNELVYTSRSSLETMLGYLKLNFSAYQILVKTSGFERFDKLFDLKGETSTVLMAKVHDFTLLNNLYFSNYKSEKEVFSNNIWYMEDM